MAFLQCNAGKMLELGDADDIRQADDASTLCPLPFRYFDDHR
jgi:hypothetical protein